MTLLAKTALGRSANGGLVFKAYCRLSMAEGLVRRLTWILTMGLLRIRVLVRFVIALARLLSCLGSIGI